MSNQFQMAARMPHRRDGDRPDVATQLVRMTRTVGQGQFELTVGQLVV